MPSAWTHKRLAVCRAAHLRAAVAKCLPPRLRRPHRMTASFFWKCRGVRSAKHHTHASTTKLVRKTIRMQSRGRRRRDPYEVCRSVEAHTLDDLIGMRDSMRGRCERSDQRHRQLRELNQAPSTQVSGLRRFGSNQVNAHSSSASRIGPGIRVAHSTAAGARPLQDVPTSGSRRPRPQ